jgi:hypothetical protein
VYRSEHPAKGEEKGVQHRYYFVTSFPPHLNALLGRYWLSHNHAWLLYDHNVLGVAAHGANTTGERGGEDDANDGQENSQKPSTDRFANGVATILKASTLRRVCLSVTLSSEILIRRTVAFAPRLGVFASGLAGVIGFGIHSAVIALTAQTTCEDAKTRCERNGPTDKNFRGQCDGQTNPSECGCLQNCGDAIGETVGTWLLGVLLTIIGIVFTAAFSCGICPMCCYAKDVVVVQQPGMVVAQPVAAK